MDTMSWTTARPDRAWAPAAGLLDAMTRRDVDAVQAVLADGVRFRALVPGGLVQADTAEGAAALVRRWFGGEDEFEVLDASIGGIGPRRYLRWRVRMWPPGRPDEARVAEQHLFTSGTPRIESLDLLCSGFHGGAR